MVVISVLLNSTEHFATELWKAIGKFSVKFATTTAVFALFNSLALGVAFPDLVWAPVKKSNLLTIPSLILWHLPKLFPVFSDLFWASLK